MQALLTAFLTAIFVVAVLVANDAIGAWWRNRRQVPPSHAEIVLAVQAAVTDVGLSLEQATPTTDLARLGKVYAVLHRSAERLDKDHELRTVQDVIDWLAVAPIR